MIHRVLDRIIFSDQVNESEKRGQLDDVRWKKYVVGYALVVNDGG